VVVGSSARLALPSGTVDLVLSDPPYHDDVHYSELSIPFRAWAGLKTSIEPGIVPAPNGRFDRSYADLLRDVFVECRRVLKPRGHLILSYANRDPRAWLALIEALDDAGYRGLGYQIVHGENETDHSKVGNGHYSHNLLVDLVKANLGATRRWRPTVTSDAPEIRFLELAGEAVLRVGDLPVKWRSGLLAELSQSAFLQTRPHVEGEPGAQPRKRS
jgi:SAM-dependent methyltransferase